MKRFAALLCGGLIAAGFTAVAIAHEGHDHKKGGDEKQTTVQGELIDAACYADGGSKGKGHAKCAGKCMASGIPAAILPQASKDASGILYLLTNPKALAPYAGRVAKVEGVVHSDLHAIDVKSISIQNGKEWQPVRLQDEHHGSADGGDAHSAHQSGADGHDEAGAHDHHSDSQSGGSPKHAPQAK